MSAQNPTLPNYHPVLYNLQRDLRLRRDNGSLKLKKLRPIHMKIVELHLRGYQNNQVADLLNVSAISISRVLNDPLVQEILHNFDEAARREFDVLRRQANAALRDGLHYENPISTRLRAANLFYKAAGDMAPKRDEAVESAEDVIQRMLQLNLQVNVNVAQPAHEDNHPLELEEM